MRTWEEALRLGKQWTQHLLADTGNTSNEGQLMQDVDGDEGECGQ